MSWLTNLGLVAMLGQDNDMTVLVHNIQNTEPERGVTVTAYNYQHQALARARPMTRDRYGWISPRDVRST